MNYISFPEIHAPQQQSSVSQDSIKSTDHVHSLETMQHSLQSDPTLKSLSKIIHEGWPQSKKDCPEQLLEFWNFRQEISRENSILYKNHRLIVPHSERPHSE